MGSVECEVHECLRLRRILGPASLANRHEAGVADQEREQRRVAREELRSVPAGAAGMQARRMEVGT